MRSAVAARKVFADLSTAERSGRSPLASIVAPLDGLTDRQLMNMLYGRDKDDDGTVASSRGAVVEPAKVVS